MEFQLPVLFTTSLESWSRSDDEEEKLPRIGDCSWSWSLSSWPPMFSPLPQKEEAEKDEDRDEDKAVCFN